MSDWDIGNPSFFVERHEFQLSSFSIARTELLDNIPWPLVFEELQNVFDHRTSHNHHMQKPYNSSP